MRTKLIFACVTGPKNDLNCPIIILHWMWTLWKHESSAVAVGAWGRLAEKDRMALSNMSDMCKHMSPQHPARPSNPQLHGRLLTKRYYLFSAKSHHHHQDIRGKVGEWYWSLVLMIRCDGTECLMEERAQPQILVSPHHSIIASDGYIKPGTTPEQD